MYHCLRLDLTGSPCGAGKDAHFVGQWYARGTFRDPNQMEDVTRGIIGTDARSVSFTYGRLKVTIELLPELQS